MLVTCPYCSKPAELVKGSVIYPSREDLAYLRFWNCEPCRAYVGCHKNSGKKATPLGRLANAPLRRWKQAAHLNFDKIWKSKEMSRSMAYQYLADRLGIEKRECHIGMFDIPMCRRVVAICTEDARIKNISRFDKVN